MLQQIREQEKTYTMSENYYELLEISQTATKEEIKSAFRKKARKYHPDVNKAPDAEEKFKALGKAYETLMDDEKRSIYDRWGEEGLSNAGYSQQGPFDAGFGNLNDIFESFFGGFGFSGAYERNPNAPRRGEDIRVDIELEFEEAVFGTEKEIKIDHLEQCEVCKGTGYEPGSKPQTCPTCGGSGRVQQVTNTIMGQFTQISTCPNCNGSGQKITNPCKECRGSGSVEKEKTINVKIPKGVDKGAKIRVSQEGDAGKNGGPNGDLYIVLHVKEHEHFKREGFDIYSEIEISVPQAVLGDDINIQTLDGDRKISVPPGTESGKIVTLKDAGVPYLNNPNKRGNHFAILKIATPKTLTDEERKLYSRLFEISTGKQANEAGILDRFKKALHN